MTSMADYPLHLYPPVPGGVADYVDVCIRHLPGGTKLALGKENARETALSGHCLLHLSGYGYAKRGAPLWLLRKLEAERGNIKTLGVYFHELYAWGPPWRSAFWLSPVQRHISRRIAELSDFWITNREDSARWLCRFAADKPHAVLPVFSNVGELPAYSSIRTAKIVVFGGAALRAATYRAAGKGLFDWLRLQGLELHDVGPAMAEPELVGALLQAGAKIHGHLESAQVSRLLSDAAFGVVEYPANAAAKSGVLAAYCAHGVCPVLIAESYASSDGLVPGRHYLAGIPTGRIDSNTIADIGGAAWEWYQSHAAGTHVAAQLELFNASQPVPGFGD